MLKNARFFIQRGPFKQVPFFINYTYSSDKSSDHLNSIQNTLSILWHTIILLFIVSVEWLGRFHVSLCLIEGFLNWFSSIHVYFRDLIS